MLEQAIAAEFARLLVVPYKDEYGNTRRTPVDEALSSWVEKNRPELIAEVCKQFSVENIAALVATDLRDALGSYVVRGRYSPNDKEAFSKRLDEAVIRCLAEKIATEKMKTL